MIALSNQVAIDNPIIPYVLAIQGAYPAGQFNMLESAGDGVSRVPVQVMDSRTQDALASDYRFPQIRDGDDPLSLVGYRNALADALDLWYDQAGAAGVPVTYQGTNYTLGAGPTSQANFTSLHALVSNGLTLGQMQATTNVTVYTVAGQSFQVAASDVAALLFGYGVQVAELLDTYHSKQGAIAAATTTAQLDAVVLGS